MSLLSFQRAFQAAILQPEEPDASELGFIAPPRRIDRAAAFGVYHTAYRLRLAEFIATDFSVLRRHLGDDRFGRLVEEYVLSKPSSHRNARWYASGLPEFMLSSQSWSADPRSCDLARFERALADAFDAADAAALDFEALHQIDVDLWPNVVFSFHPSLTLLDLEHGTVSLYESLRDQLEALGTADRAENDVVAVWRRECEVFHCVLGPDERLALNEAMLGKKFSDVCSLLSFKFNGEDVSHLIAGFLSAWVENGLITNISVEP
ncbi:HvfC/BufC N-terminal domain-containing protein [Methylocystis iwaonis]|uniref:Putative DNA-binding domain-containing protein n=1 Tax=Methylocystis iwaonis TaxID=2885079 RepID=A0ABN6V921_9HYPH|nr:DNA-binding domain-containing protein [Methylocystis iwaonis]BDV32546.1 hypothetical protein SS37A_00750 [Methylocystis iwaonis]